MEEGEEKGVKEGVDEVEELLIYCTKLFKMYIH